MALLVSLRFDDTELQPNDEKTGVSSRSGPLLATRTNISTPLRNSLVPLPNTSLHQTRIKVEGEAANQEMRHVGEAVLGWSPDAPVSDISRGDPKFKLEEVELPAAQNLESRLLALEAMQADLDRLRTEVKRFNPSTIPTSPRRKRLGEEAFANGGFRYS